jgi:hypothetical protein
MFRQTCRIKLAALRTVECDGVITHTGFTEASSPVLLVFMVALLFFDGCFWWYFNHTVSHDFKKADSATICALELVSRVCDNARIDIPNGEVHGNI